MPTSNAGMVLRRSSRRRTLQRWVSFIVQSRIPIVPSEQPSQVPWVRMRQA
jgi:hypothetical protein